MKKNIIGIIVEYNPFHNGHIYQLQEVKKMFPNSIIIVVTSTFFTQRGEISILTKFEKANTIIKYGVDIVVEIPTVFSTSGSDIFARGAIEILTKLKCDYLVFGSESNDVEMLKQKANLYLSDNFQKEVYNYISKGFNIPTSYSMADKNPIKNANDILGISYIKEIITQKSNIIPITIKRTNNFHSTDNKNKISSATSIRNSFYNNKDFSYNVPQEIYNILNKKNINNNLFTILKYKIISDDNLKQYQDVDEGLDNLLKKHIYYSNDIGDLILKIKSKRYTYNRLYRMLIHILLNMTKDNYKYLLNNNYIRVLKFNDNGKEYLNKIKKDINIITNISNIKNKSIDFEVNVSKIYSIIMNDYRILLDEYKEVPFVK